MIPLSLTDVAALVAGRVTGPPAATVTGAVEFDSRAVGPGDLFVALPGERVDGHDFAAAALAAGAVGVLSTRELPGRPAVVVPDTQLALGRLARGVVDRLPGLTVIGITGSSGKTSTKDLLAHVLAAAGPTVAPPGSFNNEIGHPYTVLRAGPATRYLVLECSARGRGHIAALCRIAPPRIGVVLNVGSAHIGEFGDRAAIADSKGELVEALPRGGLAVLNADDPLVAAMSTRTAARVVLVGAGPDAQVRAEDVRLDPAGRASFALRADGGGIEVRLPLHGAHHVGNALAVVAVALDVGLTLEEIGRQLASVRPASRWRMEVTDRADGVRIVNDAYNANPESMAAALRALAAMSAGGGAAGGGGGAGGGSAGRRRTWAVLGAMGELGGYAAPAHAEVGRLTQELGIDRVLGVGPAAAALATGGAAVEGVPDIEAVVDLLRAELRPGDIVLVKASRAVGLERVADALLAEPLAVRA